VIPGLGRHFEKGLLVADEDILDIMDMISRYHIQEKSSNFKWFGNASENSGLWVI